VYEIYEHSLKLFVSSNLFVFASMSCAEPQFTVKWYERSNCNG